MIPGDAVEAAVRAWWSGDDWTQDEHDKMRDALAAGAPFILKAHREGIETAELPEWAGRLHKDDRRLVRRGMQHAADILDWET